jgi:hypothetical protein
VQAVGYPEMSVNSKAFRDLLKSVNHQYRAQDQKDWGERRQEGRNQTKEKKKKDWLVWRERENYFELHFKVTKNDRYSIQGPDRL